MPDSRASSSHQLQDTSSATSSSHLSYLSALQPIDSIPVHDLASTLTDPAHDDAGSDDATTSFLRTQLADPQDEWRAQNADRESLEEEHRLRSRIQSMSRAADLMGRDDQARRERLQRVLARLNRLHGSAYGEGVPNHNALYDWSPGSDGEDNAEEQDLVIITRELRRQLPTHHPEVLRVMAQSVQVDIERDRRTRTQSSRFLSSHPGSTQNEQSLRSAAILQAVRRHPRFSARSREYMQRYIVDRAERERAAAETASTTATRDRFSPSHDRYPWMRPSSRSTQEAVDREARMRRSMLQEPPSTTAMASVDTSSDLLKRTIIYLGNLRTAGTYEECLGCVVDAQLVTTEFFGDQHDDFVMDVQTLNTIAPTSLLARGSKFKGHQRANPDLSPSIERSRRRWERDLGWEPPSETSRRDYLPRLTLDDPARPSAETIPPHALRVPAKYLAPDHWPVEVTIHEVDWNRMTLSATMEAQDVPSYTPLPQTRRSDSFSSLPDLLNPDGSVYIEPARAPSPAVNIEAKPDPHPRKSITTFLEGEILDFVTHTFATESFPSNPANDATYWRKLEPFRSIPAADLHRKLLSKTFLRELGEKYILMRWKERCFVDTKDSAEMAEGCGLTISGFYYVCLRREDGRIEGLYCDPQSSPYQHLVLERDKAESWWWACELK